MAPGSKRKRSNRSTPETYPSRKREKAVSSDDTQTPSLNASSSDIVAASAAVGKPSPGATAFTTRIATPEFTTQAPVLSESSTQDAADGTQTPSLDARCSDVVPAVSADESLHSVSLPKNTMPESASQVPALSKTSYQAPGTLTVSGGGFFTNASRVVVNMNNSAMIDNSNNVTVNNRSDQQARAMKHLFKHIIRGAAHDSSARSPPPRCHPDTRVEINDEILAWFYDEDEQELLVWVYGHAGVGKSAIMQTFADELAKSLRLGASVFISRLNGRNLSRQLILTIGYQLAEHIEDYYTFISEKLTRDPALVDKGMEEQFKIFIVEPFGTRKIGASAKPWTILLDGLDELDEHESQTDIIRLVANFVLEYPNAPLRWAIASRPEPHILDTFGGEDVVCACWEIHVPVDPEDVELFLEDNLERIRKKFSRTVPKDWPSEDQFRKLVNRASGLFIFANTVTRFIEDPRYANPATRLNQVLSALDGPVATSSDHPLAPLDALYASILSTIPDDVWSTTKRVLGALLFPKKWWTDEIKTLGGISVILGLDLNTIYASVNSCYSVLQLSDPEDAYEKKSTTFYHASFGDYLLDPTRSRDFYISIGDVEEDLLQSTVNFWQNFKAKYCVVPGLTYDKRWLKYLIACGFPELHPSRFKHDIMYYIPDALMIFLVKKYDPNGVPFSSKDDQDLCFDLLNDVEDIYTSDLSYCQASEQFWPWLFDLCEVYQDELESRGIVSIKRLEKIKSLEAEPRPAHMQFMGSDRNQKADVYSYDERQSHQMTAYILRLKSHSPELPVLAFGSPGNGHLLLRHQVDAMVSRSGDPIKPPVVGYLYFPCSNFDSYREAEHFLKTGFQSIQRRYSSLLPPTWPSKEQFLKVAGAVVHSLSFAHIALQFIEDPYSANPITHLDQLLALIDEVDPTDDQPSIYVDALYTHILNSIPSDMWPTIQQVLSVLLYGTTSHDFTLKCVSNISRFFDLDKDVVYASLIYCRLMVLVPPEDLYLRSIKFRYTSFCQYLMDATRSKEFYVSTDYLPRMLYNVWLDYRMQCPGLYDYFRWIEYSQGCHGQSLYVGHLHEALGGILTQYHPTELKSKEIQNQVFYALSQLDFLTMGMIQCNRPRFFNWLFAIWKMHQAELTSRGFLREIEFQKLPVDPFPDWYSPEILSHTLSHCVNGERKVIVEQNFGQPGKDSDKYKRYISGLQLFQRLRPQLQVLVGGIPGRRYAIFEYEYTEDDLGATHGIGPRKLELGDRGYYVLPFPDDMYPTQT